MTENDTPDCVGRAPAMAWVVRHRGPWFALIWAPLLLVAPVIGSLADRQFARTAFLVLLGAVYAATVWLPYAPVLRIRRRAEVVLLGLGVLGTVYLAVWRTDRGFVYPLLAIAIAIAVRTRWALSLIGSLTVSGAVAVGLESRSLDAALALGFATFFAGAATFLVHYLTGVVDELSRTREELARTAVSDERLRFSRDLHDLLGHTLSVVVVKAQAVRRLLHRDPDVAAEHARDIETIGRHALTEIRQAITGYRAVRLGEELANARAALSAGNVRVDITPPASTLDSEVDSLLGWVVREGTTNVLRHAGATRCRIAVTADDDAASVEVLDNGRGGDTGDGSGLRGLRERVEAAGGVLTATATPSGFRLAASVPSRATAGSR
jgi:two-component system sensor histidine kinase DesK